MTEPDALEVMAGLEAAIVALWRHVRHDEDCPAPARGCTCGLVEALNTAERPRRLYRQAQDAARAEGHQPGLL